MYTLNLRPGFQGSVHIIQCNIELNQKCTPWIELETWIPGLSSYRFIQCNIELNQKCTPWTWDLDSRAQFIQCNIEYVVNMFFCIYVRLHYVSLPPCVSCLSEGELNMGRALLGTCGRVLHVTVHVAIICYIQMSPILVWNAHERNPWKLSHRISSKNMWNLRNANA